MKQIEGVNMGKDYFFGKYYKFVLKNGFSFALIDYVANKEKGMQLITKDNSYFIEELDSIKIFDDHIEFNVKLDSFSLVGKIKMKNLHPLKGNAMGPFKIFSMECSHDVYSMYHDLEGELKVNGEEVSLVDGIGYIEGDKGKSFPKKYMWYNSIGKDYGVMLALATIPFGIIKFIGLLCFINIKGKEYRLCTYNFAKVVKRSKDQIIIKKGKYSLTLNLKHGESYNLKAPKNGKMSRMIKENVAINTSFTFNCKDKIILQRNDNYSSLEQMFD